LCVFARLHPLYLSSGYLHFRGTVTPMQAPLGRTSPKRRHIHMVPTSPHPAITIGQESFLTTRDLSPSSTLHPKANIPSDPLNGGRWKNADFPYPERAHTPDRRTQRFSPCSKRVGFPIQHSVSYRFPGQMIKRVPPRLVFVDAILTCCWLDSGGQTGAPLSSGHHAVSPSDCHQSGHRTA